MTARASPAICAGRESGHQAWMRASPSPCRLLMQRPHRPGCRHARRRRRGNASSARIFSPRWLWPLPNLGVVLRGHDLCLRCDQDEAQVVAKRGKQFVEYRRHVKDNFGLQGRADVSGYAQGFKFLLYFAAERADVLQRSSKSCSVSASGWGRSCRCAENGIVVAAFQLCPHLLAVNDRIGAIQRTSACVR